MENCLFCRIAAKEIPANLLLEDDHSLAFLDIDPLFPGHTLLIPKQHSETLLQLPEREVGPLFLNARLLARAVEEALDAGGSFLGINNRISQGVPHLHIHIVPRRKKDGLRGFFWPRRKYESDGHAVDTAERIRVRLRALIAEEAKP